MDLKTNDEEIILQQWKTCVEMANSVSQRRDVMNNLFVTLNLAVMAVAAVIWDIKPSIFITTAGIILCIIWILFIHYFKLLNKQKFDIIIQIEKMLPCQPFSEEWELLHKKNGVQNKNQKYVEGTKLEVALASIFIALYIFIIVAIIATGKDIL